MIEPTSTARMIRDVLTIDGHVPTDPRCERYIEAGCDAIPSARGVSCEPCTATKPTSVDGDTEASRTRLICWAEKDNGSRVCPKPLGHIERHRWVDPQA